MAPMTTPNDVHPGGDDIVDRVRVAIQTALCALEHARARRIRAQLNELLARANEVAPQEAWYDRRWRLLDGVLEIAMTIAHAPMGHVHLMDPDGADLVLRAHRGFRPRSLEDFECLAADPTPLGLAIHRGDHVMIEDTARAAPMAPDFLHGLDRAGVRALLTAPVVMDGVPVGTITVYFTAPCCATPDACLSLQFLGREAGSLVPREAPVPTAIARAS
jgi:hypothetical protein